MAIHQGSVQAHNQGSSVHQGSKKMMVQAHYQVSEKYRTKYEGS